MRKNKEKQSPAEKLAAASGVEQAGLERTTQDRSAHIPRERKRDKNSRSEQSRGEKMNTSVRQVQ